MIVAGVGFRRGVEAQEIVEIVSQALERAAVPPGALGGLATAEPLADGRAFVAAAECLSVRAIAVAVSAAAAALLRPAGRPAPPSP
jgi:cobalt-precorrin 5A hydrolase